MHPPVDHEMGINLRSAEAHIDLDTLRETLRPPAQRTTAFHNTVLALLVIKRKKLYRPEYRSFAAYTKDRWRLEKSMTSFLWQAGEVVEVRLCTSWKGVWLCIHFKLYGVQSACNSDSCGL